jgi:ABC-type transport system substrate-binding protein
MWWPNQKTPSTDWEKAIDQTFQQGIEELEPAKRKEIYRKWVQICVEQQPMNFLVQPTRVRAVRNKFGNLFPSPRANWQGIWHNEDEIFVK